MTERKKGKFVLSTDVIFFYFLKTVEYSFNKFINIISYRLNLFIAANFIGIKHGFIYI